MQTSILIAGAGPAGMAAACAASESGARVTLIDLSPTAGGQIWRGAKPSGKLSKQWFERFAKAAPERIQSARIVSAEPEARKLLAELPGNESIAITYEKLILATGARELFLPFPGWTLPGVVGAGGLQALVKSGLDVRGKRVVLAGSGPLLLAVADLLREREANVLLIAEQASSATVNRFGLKLASSPGKLAQAIGLRARLASISYLTGCWVASAQGDGCLRRVQVQQDGRRWTVDCDYLGTGYGLVPNTELAEVLGCSRTCLGVTVDDLQRTSVEGVYCAGEAAGIGGVDKSLVEGVIAGYSATDNPGAAQALFVERARTHKFAKLLNTTFALRAELRSITTPETIVCRCEDVRLSEFDAREGWRDAKLQSRCGMGRCQGRVCGPAVEFLKGWKSSPAKPPIFPARVGTLVADDEVES
ncbi:MAG TPA: FAD/NAD(P)-binding oxidoreductase [Bryobacteraceae bacterium]|nr:FAD/NAD(P)-binding oxidoreductase [Bryobacteraceae bacterium]